jgi:YHS domain-containing protein
MTSPELVTDPVCGMLIHPRNAAGVRTFADVAYHLCSLGCLAKFDADGPAYIAAARVEGYRTWQATVLTHVNSAPHAEQQEPPHP